MTRLWILGAPDPEMAAIERLLTVAGETVVHATADGRRVHPGSAYRADTVDCAGHDMVPAAVYLVECQPSMVIDSSPVDGPVDVRTVVIDHHRPGDPGYGRPPAESLPASSIGQVIAELAQLGLPVPGDDEAFARAAHRSRLIAAADHCLGAAYRGECPGVDPDELMRWRAESRATFQGRPVDEVLADIEAAQSELRAAQSVMLSGPQHVSDPTPLIQVRDMRRDEPIPELPEAAIRMGASYISGPIVGPDGRRKITCSGLPEHVRAFLDRWAPSQGLCDTYGDPARGFAGGYLPPA